MTVVVEKEIRIGLVIQRTGIVVGGIKGAIGGIELHVASDEEIQAAVAIVVQPGGADGPTFHVEAGLGRDVFERSVAAVAIERYVTVGGDQQIGVAVVVEVGCDRGE